MSRKIFVAEFGVKQKSPFLALSLREALLFRIEEVGRSAYESFMEKDLCSAIILARASLENAALMWTLCELVSNRREFSEDNFNCKLKRLALGWKGEKEFPGAGNVLGMIDKMDRFLKGTRNRCNMLSEVVHPNWNGVIGMYCSFDRNEFSANFANNSRKYYERATPASMALVVALSLSRYAYNSISDMMDDWVNELDKL